MKDRFEQFDDEFLKFENIPDERKLHRRPDVCAFLLLDRIVGGDGDMVTAAEHDEIWLDVSPDDLAKASDEDILTLVRCGVRYDANIDALAMFV